jgi:hypothetical protein
METIEPMRAGVRKFQFRRVAYEMAIFQQSDLGDAVNFRIADHAAGTAAFFAHCVQLCSVLFFAGWQNYLLAKLYGLVRPVLRLLGDGEQKPDSRYWP